MNRTHWYVVLLQIGVLAIFACSSDDTAPDDTSGAGGSDSGADHGAAGGASGSQQGGSAHDASTGGSQLDAAVDSSSGGSGGAAEVDVAAEATLDSMPEGSPSDLGDAALEGSAPDAFVDQTNDAPSDVDAGSGSDIDASDAATDAAAADATTDVDTDAQSDAPCGVCPTGVCLEGGVCAACLPGSSDSCPSGQYCTDEFACVAGCKGDNDCQSGVCTNHDCERCQGDLECSAGHVCGSGACAAACTGQGDCSNGLDCCTSHCVSLARDIQHCGGCATACEQNQFCSTTGCAAVTLANVCDNAKTTKILDTYPPDDASGAVLQNGITSNCLPLPVAGSSSKGSAGPVNPTTGQPVEGGGNLLTVAGGYYVQPLVAYLDQAGVTPVYLEHDTLTNWRFLQRGGSPEAGLEGGATDALVAEIPQGDHAHDIILVETVRDPESGTLLLITYGQYEESTAAAARYVATQMLPAANRSSYDKSWYVYEWTAASEAGPETYTLKATAP